MSRRGPEGKIQDKVLKYAREKDILYKKQEVGRFMVSSGWPDALFFPDRSGKGMMSLQDGGYTPFFIEFKAPGGRLTDLQQNVKKKLEARDYAVYVVDDADEGIKILERECL